MQKKLIALAIAGLSGTAFAQSNVTVYGVLDAAYVSMSGTYQNAGAYTVGAAAQKSFSGIQGGQSASNRLGFKGEEALGNGLKAQFVFETNLNSDGGAAAGAAGTTGLEVSSRTATVGLSGGWGSVNFGRQYTPFFSTVAAVDPFGSVGMASAAILHPAGVEGITRASSSARYDGKFGPVSVGVLYGFGEDTSSAAGGNTSLWSFNALYGYSAGVVGITHIDIQDPINVNAALVADDDAIKATGIGGVHNFGAFSIHYIYDRIKTSGATLAAAQVDHGDWLLGAVIPMGKSTFKISYNNANDKSTRDQDATQIGLGYQYDLSKRTALYGVYSKVSNKNGAAYAVNRTAGGAQGTTNLGAGAAVGQYTTGLALGLKHSF